MNLAIVACHFNPSGFQVPRRNLLRFVRQMEAEGVPLFLAELAYGDAPWIFPETDQVLHLRTTHNNILWHKENLINLVVEQIVPESFEAIAWLDADLWLNGWTGMMLSANHSKAMPWSNSSANGCGRPKMVVWKR